MQSYLGCDAHKHYSVFVAVDERGSVTRSLWCPVEAFAYKPPYAATRSERKRTDVPETGDVVVAVNTTQNGAVIRCFNR
jgi:hypothetical protein